MHQRFSAIILALLAGAFVLHPSSAFASPACAPTDKTSGLDFFYQSKIDASISLGDFIGWLGKAEAKQVTGVFVCGKLALAVEQQPDGDPVFVSKSRAAATQFRPAAQYGTIALLAHNELSGSQFFNLRIGDQVDVVFGDGTIRRSRVSEIRRFRALEPENPYSNFQDLDSAASVISSTQVFQQMFASGDRVVLQTCIETEGNPAWGRLFVIATPIPVN